MILFRKAARLHDFMVKKKSDGNSLGFVPTMGALHEGHLSLIKRSKEENDITVCSIYVNPTQFNDPKDLEKYPRPVENDISLLSSVDCDILFLPGTEEIYPSGMDNLKNYDLGHLENFLEGASRPGHFKGVANVVDRFLQIVQPDHVYLGQKDFQQVKVIEKMVSSGSWTVRRTKPQIIMCEIVRESDGLAMSSRNVRLSSSQRKNAPGISRELLFIRDHWKEFDLANLKQQAIQRLNSISEMQVDYLEFCDADSFQLVHDWKDAKQIVCVTAVKNGDVRLLDNVILN